VESHLELARRLVPGLPHVNDILDEISQIRRMLHALRVHHLRRPGKS
jgi:hypothetical protein